jgi:hypothetical protein
MKAAVAVTSLLALTMAHSAIADSFGSGGNAFNIDFVTVGNPGNAADTTGIPNPAGSVSYTFRMAKYEISEDEFNKAGLGVVIDNRGPKKPATRVSWFNAAQFVNLLNTMTGSVPAYKFDRNGNFHLWSPTDAGYDFNNPYRNRLARYFLPNVDEWYKAAYFDPSSASYFDYPTQSDSAPFPVTSGTSTNTAVYGLPLFTEPADVALTGANSPYGTMGQGGNAWEWQETAYDFGNDSEAEFRGIRGGVWTNGTFFMSASSWQAFVPPESGSSDVGFRVASTFVPEPSALTLTIASVAALPIRRRKMVPHNCV